VSTRAFLLHRSKFQRNYADPMFGTCQGALIVFTNGRYWYHNGTNWSPNKGLSAQEWIKLFHTNVPMLDDDEFGIVFGLTDDQRGLLDMWTESNVRDCLNTFLAQFPEEYVVWPEGEILQPLAKSRMLSAKRQRISKAAVLSTAHPVALAKGGRRSPRRHAAADEFTGQFAKQARMGLI
jgi:hypothetical protein